MPEEEHKPDSPVHTKAEIEAVHETAKKLEKHRDIDNPYALAWWLHGHHRLRKGS